MALFQVQPLEATISLWVFEGWNSRKTVGRRKWGGHWPFGRYLGKVAVTGRFDASFWPIVISMDLP
jgi:hypothetical protein